MTGATASPAAPAPTEAGTAAPPVRAEPSFPVFLAEQIRAEGTAVRREATVLVVGLFLFCAFLIAFAHRADEALHLRAHGDLGVLSTMAAFGALFAPLAVWKGEPRFGMGPIWLLPFGHRKAALAKVAAGWVWTMAVLAVVIAMVAAVAFSTGATFGGDKLLSLSPTADAGAMTSVLWTMQWWELAALVTAPTLAYLATSALLLGTRYPGRWVIGAAVLLFVLVGSAEMIQSRELITTLNGLADAALFGPFGLDAVLTGGVESFETVVRTGPEPNQWVGVQTELPTAGRWLGATAAWLTVLLAALVAAASRRRGW